VFEWGAAGHDGFAGFGIAEGDRLEVLVGLLAAVVGDGTGVAAIEREWCEEEIG